MGNSTITETWWVVTFASFIVALIFFLNHNSRSNNISLLQNLTLQSPMPPDNNIIVNEEEAAAAKSANQFQSCIPVTVNQDLTETPSSEIPLLGLQNSKPSDNDVKQETPTLRVPFSGLEDAKPSELTHKVEGISTTSSSSQVPALDVQNQEPPKHNDDEEPKEEEKKCNLFQGKWVYDRSY